MKPVPLCIWHHTHVINRLIIFGGATAFVLGIIPLLHSYNVHPPTAGLHMLLLQRVTDSGTIGSNSGALLLLHQDNSIYPSLDHHACIMRIKLGRVLNGLGHLRINQLLDELTGRGAIQVLNPT